MIAGAEKTVSFEPSSKGYFPERFGTDDEVAARDQYIAELKQQRVEQEHIWPEFEGVYAEIQTWQDSANLGNGIGFADDRLHGALLMLAQEAARSRPSIATLMRNPKDFQTITTMLAAYAALATKADEAGISVHTRQVDAERLQELRIVCVTP